jgi:hypothetical protein
MVADEWGFVVVHTPAVVDGRCAEGFDHALLADDAR